MFFRRKEKPAATHLDQEEILYLSKSKYNKYGTDLKNKLTIKLQEVMSTTKIKIKRVKMDSKIDEYDDLSFNLICGLLFQLNHRLKGESLFVGDLSIKAYGDEIEINMKHIQGQNFSAILNKEFQTGFGSWGFFENHSLCLVAKFSKEKYKEFVSQSASASKAGRRNHV